MQVKVCGLKDRENLSEVIHLNPDFIGFVFFPASARYIGNDMAMQHFIKSIKTVSKVGVFVNDDCRIILAAVQNYGLNFIQLHGDETPDFCTRISRHIPVIKAFRIDQEFDFSTLTKYQNCCDYFLFDTATVHYGGSGRVFDWHLLKKYNLEKSYFLSGGIGLDNFHEVVAIQDSRLIFLDVNSRLETAPGIKNIKDLKTLIHEIRN